MAGAGSTVFRRISGKEGAVEPLESGAPLVTKVATVVGAVLGEMAEPGGMVALGAKGERAQEAPSSSRLRRLSRQVPV